MVKKYQDTPRRRRTRSVRDKRFIRDMQQLEKANKLCVRYKGTDRYQWAYEQAMDALERVNSPVYS